MEPIDQANLPDADPNDCWGPCSVTCGIGFRQNIKKEDECASFPRTQVCTPGGCKLDCEFEWNSWGRCSATCGSGRHFRGTLIKKYPVYGGRLCPQTEEEACNPEDCPTLPPGHTTSTVTTTTTTPTPTTTMYFTTTPAWPMDEVEEAVAKVFQTMGCTFILACLTVTLLVFLAMRYCVMYLSLC